jgi:hypothetical protein
MNLVDVPSKVQRMSAGEITQKPKNRMKIEARAKELKRSGDEK